MPKVRNRKIIAKKVVAHVLAAVMCVSTFSGTLSAGAVSRSENTTSYQIIATNPDSGMDVWTATSNENIFRDNVKEEMSNSVLDLYCVRNEFESAQILLRNAEAFDITSVSFTDLENGENRIASDNMKYNFVEYEYLTNNSAGQNASTVVRSAPADFPDALSNETTVWVEADSTQPIWVRVYIPKGTPAGLYIGSVQVSTSKGGFTVPVQVQVYDITIPDSKDAEFSFSFWSNLAGTWELNDEDDQIKRLYGYDRYSDEWWELIGNVADLMRENRSNNLYINPLTLVKDGPNTYIDEEGIYHFDWSRFDEYIEFFMDKGVVKQLEGMTLLACVYGSDYNVYTLIGEPNEPLRRETLSYDDPRSQAWLEQFIPAYVEHITEKGWDSIWIQHIGDEPFNVAAQTTKWGAVRDMIRELNPNIRCGDAVDNTDAFSAVRNLDSDIYFPILSVHEENVEICDELRADGKEVYIYTCLNPQGSWLNRYVDKPVWQMKTIGWLSYMRGATGHLHWGFNEWFKHPTNIYHDISIQNYKGDNFTVYPDVDLTTTESGALESSTPRRPAVKSSIRYEAVRDACEDYEIFKILEQRDGTLAKEIAGSIVTDGRNYTTDIAVMAQQRRVLLEEASLKALSSSIEQASGNTVGEAVFTYDALPQGSRYFYAITEGQADASLTLDLIGQEKPAAYTEELVSGESMKIANGSYLNVVEVDGQELVRTYMSILVTDSKRPSASEVALSKEITMEPTEAEGVYKLVYDAILGENQIVNGDFEQGEEGWTNIKNFTVTDDGVDGSKSARDGMPEGGSEQPLPNILPNTTYVFRAQGKVTKEGEKGWTTVESSTRALKIDLEFTGLDYEVQEQTFTTPSTPDTYKALTWKNDSAYGGFNDTYFYADNITLRSVDVEVGNGHVYYAMSNTAEKAPEAEVGSDRPEAYDTLLKKNCEFAVKEGGYLNVVEVDRNDKVVAMKSVLVGSGQVDKTGLKDLYNENRDRVETAYTDGSWANFQAAMDNAKAVLDNADVTQTEVNEASTALQSAVDGLVNISTLEYVLGIANGHVEAGDVDKLVPSAQEVFNKVLASAQAVYDDPNATQEQVDTAWKALMHAIQAMGFVPGDKSELIDLVAEANGLDLNVYEDGAEKEAFTAALKAAEDLISDPDAMVLDIEAAYNALSDAMQKLIPKPAEGDKTELKKVIDEADVKNSELDRYVDDAEAKQKFADTLAAAKDVYEKDGATQEEIDQAKNNLINAMAALRLRAEKSSLEQWLEDLKSIDLSQYTEESAAVVREVIAKAEALAAQELDENDQDLINAMVAEMAIAKAQLVPAPADPEDPENPDPGDGSGESSNPDSGKPDGDGSSQNGTNSEGKQATGEVPTTGDSAPIAALSVLAVAAAGLWLTVRKRKQQN